MYKNIQNDKSRWIAHFCIPKTFSANFTYSKVFFAENENHVDNQIIQHFHKYAKVLKTINKDRPIAKIYIKYYKFKNIKKTVRQKVFNYKTYEVTSC